MPSQSETDSVVFIIDDSAEVRDGLKALFESVNIRCEVFASTNEFLRRQPVGTPSCLILDVRLPGTGGLDFQTELADAHITIPIVFITGHGDIQMSVRAMKAGAIEFLTKPFREQEILDAVRVALDRDRVQRRQDDELRQVRKRYETLGDRERKVLACVAEGLLNKQTAAKLNLSENTVKVHRHNLVVKLGAKSVAELVRMADILGLGRGSVL